MAASEQQPGTVAGLVLAAGRATRFGRTKQLVEVDGRPLVVHAVDAAAEAGLSPVLVVVGHDADRVRAVLPPAAAVVVNDEFDTGQASSLRAGIAAARDRGVGAVVVLLADQPGVTPDAVRAVVAAHAAGAEVARARYDDRPGHPVLLARSTWAALERLRGDVGAREVLGNIDVTEVSVPGPCPRDVDHPDDIGS